MDKNEETRTMRPIRHRFASVLLPPVFLCIVSGCLDDEEHFEKRPRPVRTLVIESKAQHASRLKTGTVASWKTEQIGFEVSGRVESIVEDNTRIRGRIADPEGKAISPGQPIARLETHRYELRVAAAEADLAKAKQSLAAAKTDLELHIPAQISSAEVSLRLAKQEYSRSKRLNLQNAGSQSDEDQKLATRDNAVARVLQLEAAKQSQQANVKALENAVAAAEQQLQQARRDLRDCTLYASFDGQVSSTMAVPGSVVEAGQPVAMFQMMDPIAIEMEVSAALSKQLRRASLYPIHVTMPDGSVEIHEGYLDTIDSVADPELRTYTLTFLVVNKRLGGEPTPETPTTTDLWQLDLPFISGANEGQLLAPNDAIFRDSLGHYVWQLDSRDVRSHDRTDGLVSVSRLPVRVGNFRTAFMGKWMLQEVFIDDPDIDETELMIAGPLKYAGQQDSAWKGNQVRLVTENHWMMRPGDLVQVDLSPSSPDAGLRLPIDAIGRAGGESHVFVVAENNLPSGNQPIVRQMSLSSVDEYRTVKKVPVKVLDDRPEDALSEWCLIESLGADLVGRRCVVEGTQYLNDGETVLVVLDSEETR